MPGESNSYLLILYSVPGTGDTAVTKQKPLPSLELRVSLETQSSNKLTKYQAGARVLFKLGSLKGDTGVKRLKEMNISAF